MFEYRENELFCESMPVSEIVARDVGTPTYVYSYSALVNNYSELDRALADVKHVVCFSVKSNSNIAVLRSLIQQGAGLDVVSAGELYRGLQAGADPSTIVFAGVGKNRSEIEYALDRGILFLTVESIQELATINGIATERGVRAPIALRVNPDVDAGTHEYVTTGRRNNKFGVTLDQARAMYESCRSLDGIEIRGVQMHIGSQILSPEPYRQALTSLAEFAAWMRDEFETARYIDIGGGIGVRYNDESPLTAADFAEAVVPLVAPLGLTLVVEPGRFIAANAGILVTRVEYVKQTDEKTFVIVDAGMNDLIRPALYKAFHEVAPVVRGRGRDIKADIVGPVCETGDYIALDRTLEEVRPGDLLAVFCAGAYGFTMCSNYNTRPRPAEVLVRGGDSFTIRIRESYEDMIRDEDYPDWVDQYY